MQLNTRKRQPVAAFWYSALLPLALSLCIFILGSFFAAILFSSSASCAVGACASLLSGVSLLTFLVAVVVLAYPILYYLLFTYEVHERALTINSGILFRQYETIDFNKIQTIDNERNPLLMIFGLTRVEIWTASADQLHSGTGRDAVRIRPRPDTHFLLGKNDASELRDYIMRTKTSA